MLGVEVGVVELEVGLVVVEVREAGVGVLAVATVRSWKSRLKNIIQQIRASNSSNSLSTKLSGKRFNEILVLSWYSRFPCILNLMLTIVMSLFLAMKSKFRWKLLRNYNRAPKSLPTIDMKKDRGDLLTPNKFGKLAQKEASKNHACSFTIETKTHTNL